MGCFLINAPLDPSRLPIRSAHHPTRLETWSRQGLVTIALCTRGREPLRRSASRRLGFVIDSFLGTLATSSWLVLAAYRAAFRVPLACFWGGVVGVYPHQ